MAHCQVPVTEEADIFEALGLAYRPPEQRELLELRRRNGILPKVLSVEEPNFDNNLHFLKMKWRNNNCYIF